MREGSTPSPGTMTPPDCSSICPTYTLEEFQGICRCGFVTDETLGWSEYYDAFYCKVCRHWLTPKCGHADCRDCIDRPETVPQWTPSAVYEAGFLAALHAQGNGILSVQETLPFPVIDD